MITTRSEGLDAGPRSDGLEKRLISLQGRTQPRQSEWSNPRPMARAWRSAAAALDPRAQRCASGCRACSRLLTLLAAVSDSRPSACERSEQKEERSSERPRAAASKITSRRALSALSRGARTHLWRECDPRDAAVPLAGVVAALRWPRAAASCRRGVGGAGAPRRPLQPRSRIVHGLVLRVPIHRGHLPARPAVGPRLVVVVAGARRCRGLLRLAKLRLEPLAPRSARRPLRRLLRRDVPQARGRRAEDGGRAVRENALPQEEAVVAVVCVQLETTPAHGRLSKLRRLLRVDDAPFEVVGHRQPLALGVPRLKLGRHVHVAGESEKSLAQEDRAKGKKATSHYTHGGLNDNES